MRIITEAVILTVKSAMDLEQTSVQAVVIMLILRKEYVFVRRDTMVHTVSIGLESVMIYVMVALAQLRLIVNIVSLTHH